MYYDAYLQLLLYGCIICVSVATQHKPYYTKENIFILRSICLLYQVRIKIIRSSKYVSQIIVAVCWRLLTLKIEFKINSCNLCRCLSSEKMGDENYIELTPPKARDAAQRTSLELLPQSSRKRYEIVYNKNVLEANKNVSSFSEDMMLVYFTEIASNLNTNRLHYEYTTPY